MLQNDKTVRTQYMINGDRKNNFFIEIDFKRYEIRCFTEVVIEQGKAQAQTSALLKKFNSAASLENIFINARYPRKKIDDSTLVSIASLMEDKEANKIYRCVDKNKGDEIKSFEIKTKDTLGPRLFLGNKNFIKELESISRKFLEQVMI